MLQHLFAVLLGAATLTLPHSPDLYVSSFFGSAVQRYYGPYSAVAGPRPLPGKSGANYVMPVARRPWGLAFGPDGNLYVANFGTGSDAIMRVQGPFSITAGAVSTFVDSGAFFDVAFGPDGNVYAAGRGPVIRYDLITGASLGSFTRGHDLFEVHAIAFGSDGLLYVANYDSCAQGPTGCTGFRSEIVRFDAKTGDFIDVFLTSSQSSLRVPWDLAFGPGDSLCIANGAFSGDGSILRFDRPCGRTRSVHGPINAEFVRYPGLNPLAITFGPDQNLYVSNGDGGNAGSILRFDSRTGDFLGAFVPSVDGGPRGIAFAPGLN